MIPFSLRQLEYFQAAAETGSTVAASRLLNVSQPAISKAIQDLETTWGEQLFRRVRSRGLVLTAPGNRRYEAARAILRAARACNHAKGENGLAGRLSIGLLSTFAPLYAPAILHGLATTFPDASIHLVEDNIHALEQGVAEGRLDAAFVYDTPTTSSTTRLDVVAQSPYLLLPENHALLAPRSPRPLTLADVADMPLVLIDLPCSREYFLSLFHASGVRPHIGYRTASLETARALVAHGFGYSVLTTAPHSNICYTGKRVAVYPLTALPPQKLCLLLPSDDTGAVIGQALATILRAAHTHTGMALSP
ncbi:MAG: LysR family transcriptional regulator [Acetobacter sp.]|uniref:LysR family transcriptional regulator n=1 Tax=Acetobacter sp. TaxID=440 RepID=UPI0039EA83FA